MIPQEILLTEVEKESSKKLDLLSVNTIFYIQFSFVTFQESNYFCMYRHNALSEGHGFLSLSIPFDLLPQCQNKMAVPAF